MGLSADEANLVIGKLAEVDDVVIGDKEFKVNVIVPTLQAQYLEDQIRFKRTGEQRLAKGGITTRPTRALIGEGGVSEAVIPLNKQGIGRVAKSLAEYGGGDGTVINLTVNALDPRAAAKAVVEALQVYERMHGAIPVNVRI